MQWVIRKDCSGAVADCTITIYLAIVQRYTQLYIQLQAKRKIILLDSFHVFPSKAVHVAITHSVYFSIVTITFGLGGGGQCSCVFIVVYNKMG